MTSRTCASVGCGPKSVRIQVAPPSCHGSSSVPGSRSITSSNGPGSSPRCSATSPASSASASGPGSSIGKSPSQRTARRRGRRWGQRAATQMGILGLCTGRGSNSPAQNSVRRASPRSSRCARARVDDLAEPFELVVPAAAEPDTENQAPLAQVIEGDRLARELVHAPPGEWRDEGSEPDALGVRGDRAQRDPRVGDGADRRSVEDVIPQEHAVPALLLGVHRQSEEHFRIGQLVEWRQVEPAPKAAIVRRHVSRPESRHAPPR